MNNRVLKTINQVRLKAKMHVLPAIDRNMGASTAGKIEKSVVF